MRYATKLLLLALAFPLALSTAHAQSSGPAPGSCTSGSAQRDLDANNVLARVFNTGSLFFGEGSQALYIVPRATATLPTPQSPVFASGIWIGGRVDGEPRVAGSRYANFEFWPGPLDASARPVNPEDCSEFDQIWKVTREDIVNYEITGVATPDLAAWPADLGAPVIAAPDNGVDDDNDGFIDEGTNFDDQGQPIDDDGDGFANERDEQERLTDGSYNLAAGDRPDIIGDQGIWWVMNDVGNVHQETNSDPLGVEVQVLAWAFNRSDVLGDATFYRYTVINKSDEDITETYLSVFSDPDLGDAVDDFIGSDTTLSLGFVYNADNADAVYGVPPALGYDFFQGPIVDGDTLGLTRFSYFENIGSGPTADPATLDQYYNFMQGLWGDGVPMTEGGNGYQTGGAITKFAFPGDPVTGEFWSEVDEGNVAGDRRFVVTTGPFTLEPDTPQDIVFGIVYAQGGDNLSSITALRSADDIAQTAYDADFELAQPAPNPPRCDANSDVAALQPGSGTCAEVVELNGQAAIVWGYPSFSENYLGAYEELDRLLAGRGAEDETYNFEGFNIYRYPTSQFRTDQRELVATYDIANEVTTIIDTTLNEQGLEVPFIAAQGTNSGLQFYHIISEDLTNYTDYYYGLTTYSYNEESTPDVIESAALTFTIRPGDIAAGSGGQFTQTELGQTVAFVADEGNEGVATVEVQVVDPTALTGDTYTIEYYTYFPQDSTAAPLLTFNILREGEVVFNGGEFFELRGADADLADAEITIDGLAFYNAFIPGQPDLNAVIVGDGDGFVETEHPQQPPCPDEDDPGCALGLGNTVFNDPNVTDDYYYSSSATGVVTRLYRYISSLAPFEVEIRYTDEGGYGLEFGAPETFGTPGVTGARVIRVPFELWYIGADGETRMIPHITPDTGDSGLTLDWYAEDPFVGVSEDDGASPATNAVYFMMPDRANGYELFEAAALASGGAGQPFQDTDDEVTEIDEANNEVGDISAASGSAERACIHQGGYVSWCYRNDTFVGSSDVPNSVGSYFGIGDPVLDEANQLFVYPIGRVSVVDADTTDAEDEPIPPVGTVNVINTVTGFLPGDMFTLDTSGLVLITGQDSLAEASMENIAAVPNPYIGRSEYETGNLDRIMRFTNLPDRATIRIYTIAGTLIKELFHNEGRSTDWDLTTMNNLPVASGIYLVHIEGRSVNPETQAEEVIGETVLKVGVVNRRTQVNVF